MSISRGRTLVPNSRSSVKVKVKYQGHSFQKNGHCGGISVSHSLLFLFLFLTVHINHKVPFPFTTIVASAVNVDQDQATQNVQLDLLSTLSAVGNIVHKSKQ